MKVLFSLPDVDGWMTLHFDCELPLPPASVGPLRLLRCSPCFSRATRLRRVAVRMAEANRGRFVVEMPDSAVRFQRFLETIVVLDGVERVAMEDRYRMRVRLGRQFSPARVARRVAECVRRHFYPEEKKVTVEPLPPDDLPLWLLED